MLVAQGEKGQLTKTTLNIPRDLRYKTMTNKLIYIRNDYTKLTNFSFDFIYWLKRLDSQLNEQTNQNSIKVPKVVKQRYKKRYYKTLETIVINSPLYPPSLNTLPQLIAR